MDIEMLGLASQPPLGRELNLSIEGQTVSQLCGLDYQPTLAGLSVGCAIRREIAIESRRSWQLRIKNSIHKTLLDPILMACSQWHYGLKY